MNGMMYRLVHDPHPMHLEGHHFTLEQIKCCFREGVFLPGTMFRVGKQLFTLTSKGLTPTAKETLVVGKRSRVMGYKLSPEEQALIRLRRSRGERVSHLAREYNVSTQHIYNVEKR